MEPLGISWLIASSSSPLVAVLALWTIYVFHTFRRRWRTVDLFLLTVISLELVISIFTFCYAIISLINPPFKTPCHFTQWGLIATRTFQVATLTSMVVDRSLTVRWPYRYRFSVRRNQIRYHIGVLVLVSVLVGVAAVFARSSKDTKHCHLHPVQWDIKYIVFLLSLYGILMLISLICMIQVEIYRSKNGTKLSANGSFQLPECASPELPSATGMNSPLDTHSSTGSTRALHRPTRQASRRPYGKNSKSTSDLRWPSVALTCLLCYSLNHIPYLVLMSIATWSPVLWSPWHEAILTWLGLFEGIFAPLLLFCKDHALRTALRRTFQRRSGALSPLVGDDGPFQMYFDKDHFRKRGTFGSVAPVGIITNYRRTPGSKKRRCYKKNGAKYTLPGLHGADSVLAKSCFGAGFGEQALSKLSCADLTSLEMWREEEEENFYATLSDDFSTFSCKSADDSALSEDMRISEELYGGSFTTIANDDFEFHDTRPCGGEVRMRPGLTSTPPPIINSFSAGVSRNVSFREKIQKVVHLQSNISHDNSNELFDLVTSPEEEYHKDTSAFILPTSEWKYQKIDNSDVSSPSDLSSNSTPKHVIPRPQKSTSFSMNDLDLINKRSINQFGDNEASFMLPVKSESTMSLYRMNVERDLDQMAMTPSKSENNINGDSGFGSGAQSTNPVWSGFLCRKPSDPFWNIRKPTVATAVSPTSNYSAILHPRMRKIPWISAWKKLDSNSDSYKARLVETQSQSSEKMVWTDSAMYSKPEVSNPLPDNQVSTIEEELSDVGTPLFAGDYNLNIFAKESGVLLENAYGKIERDDCGVKVNFYGENVQYDAKGGVYGDKNTSENIFDASFESEKPVYESTPVKYRSPDNYKIENHIYEPLNVKRNDSDGIISNSNSVSSSDQTSSVETSTSGDTNNENNNYKCELRLNGGHYENLFGTKENIFAQCDQYKSKADINPRNSNLERKPSDRRDSERFTNSNSPFSYADANAIYGHLKKPERKESFNKNKDLNRKVSDSRNKKCAIKRRESKTRNDKKPDFQKTRNQFENLQFSELSNKEYGESENHQNRVELEMKSVPNRNDLNCISRHGKVKITDDFRTNVIRRDSQNKRSRENSQETRRSMPENHSPYIEIRDDRGVKILRRESINKPKDSSRERPVENCDQIYSEPRDILWQNRVERRDSGRHVSVDRNESVRRINVDRNDSGRRLSSERSEIPRRLSAERRRASAERTDSGRHINIQRRNSSRCANIQRNENERASKIERRDSAKIANVERRDSNRVAKVERRDSAKNTREVSSQVDRRDSNRYSRRDDAMNGIQRLESQSKKSGEVKNEGLWVNAIPFDVKNQNGEKNGNSPIRESRKEAYDLNKSPRKSNIPRRESRGRTELSGDPVKRKVSGSRGKREQTGESLTDNKILRKEYTKWPPKNDSHFDDFIKYRDKCEDNFSHIQNLNRETSAEREHAKVEQLTGYGKLNGNVNQNGETFQEQKNSPLFQNSKPTSDINDNCGQKKLAITDFL